MQKRHMKRILTRSVVKNLFGRLQHPQFVLEWWLRLRHFTRETQKNRQKQLRVFLRPRYCRRAVKCTLGTAINSIHC